MKRKLAITMVSIVVLLSALLPLGAPSALAAPDYSNVRVKLSNGTPSSQSVTITGSYAISQAPNIKVAAGKNTITNSNGKLSITTGGKKHAIGSKITLVNANYKGTNNTIKAAGHRGTNTYLGNMEFVASGTKINAFSTVTMDHYIHGVLLHEMDNSWNVEALKAQAVAARSFVCDYINRGVSLTDTPTHQVYGGYNAKANRVIAAATGTAGKVIKYNGKIVAGYYSASNGGQTELPGNAWHNGNASVNKVYSYLQMKDDPYDFKNTSAQAEKTFVPKVISAANKTRVGMNSKLYTAIMKALGNPSSATLSVNLTRRYASPSKNHTKAAFSATVGGKKKTYTLNLSGYSSNGLGLFDKSILRMRSVIPGKKNGVDGWTICNVRYGHGVGLSQWGAQQMASEGKNYTQIINFYFTGVTIGTISTSGSSPDSVTPPPVAKPAVLKGWQKSGSKTYYYKNGKKLTGWQTISNKRYYFDTKGEMEQGWMTKAGYKYYFNPSTGVMYKGMQNIGSKTYYFSSLGRMQKGRWFTKNGKRYYFDTKGVMKKGWLVKGGFRYYLNPKTGAMMKGLQIINKQTYIFDTKGRMQKNKLQTYKGKKYYLNVKGIAQKGWQKIGKKKYYFDTNTLQMKKGKLTLKGKIYTFDKKGILKSTRNAK